jgi:kynurenine/2-aminoadipate aminotransferase
LSTTHKLIIFFLNQASALSQMVASKLLNHWGEEGFRAHVRTVQGFYGQRRDTLCQFASKHLSGLAEWNAPSAGMFLWIKCLGINDSKTMIKQKAVDKRVLFVPGNSFSVDLSKPSPYVRAAFSMASPADMEEAMKRLADVITQQRAVETH